MIDNNLLGKPLDRALAEDESTGFHVAGISYRNDPDGEYLVCPIPISQSLAIALVFEFTHCFPDSLFEAVEIPPSIK